MNVFEYLLYFFVVLKFFSMVYKDLREDTQKDALIGFAASLCWAIGEIAIIYCAVHHTLII